MKRFPVATTKEQALEYYNNRAIQFLKYGWKWDGSYYDHGWGIEINLRSEYGKLFSSIYVLEQGEGHLSHWFKTRTSTTEFVTSNECESMVSWLNKKNIKHRSIECDFSYEHTEVRKFYGDKRAKRSNLPLINHIDEGIYMLQKLKARHATMNAWCLHPLLQEDEALKSFYKELGANFFSRSIAIAMEYRWVANSHLSFHNSKIPKLSCISEVNDLLKVDKIQNCKDFEVHLMGRADVPNSDRLQKYFHEEWFPVLNITEEDYANAVLDVAQSSGQAIDILWINGRATAVKMDEECK